MADDGDRCTEVDRAYTPQASSSSDPAIRTMRDLHQKTRNPSRDSGAPAGLENQARCTFLTRNPWYGSLEIW